MSVPWAWVRRAIAERWGVPPRYVSHEVPHQEVLLEVQLMEIEARARAFWKAHPRGR